MMRSRGLSIDEPFFGSRGWGLRVRADADTVGGGGEGMCVLPVQLIVLLK